MYIVTQQTKNTCLDSLGVIGYLATLYNVTMTKGIAVCDVITIFLYL